MRTDTQDHPVIKQDGMTIARMLKEVLIPSGLLFGKSVRWVDYRTDIDPEADADQMEGIWSEELSVLIGFAYHAENYEDLRGPYQYIYPVFTATIYNDEGDIEAEIAWPEDMCHSISDALFKVWVAYEKSKFNDRLRCEYEIQAMKESASYNQ